MDVGSGWTRMGLAGQEKPSCVFPSIVGRVDLRAYDRISGQVRRAHHTTRSKQSGRWTDKSDPFCSGPFTLDAYCTHNFPSCRTRCESTTGPRKEERSSNTFFTDVSGG